MPVTASLVVSALPAAIGGLQYLTAGSQANKMPKYSTDPQAQGLQQQNINQLTGMANQGLPASDVALYSQGINRSTNTALGSLNSRNAGVAGVQGIANAENDAYGTLASKDSDARLANQLRLISSRSTMSNFLESENNKKYQYNQLNPYYQKLALQGAGEQNIVNGAQSFAGNSMTNQNTQILKKLLQQMQTQNNPSNNLYSGNNMQYGGSTGGGGDITPDMLSAASSLA